MAIKRKPVQLDSGELLVCSFQLCSIDAGRTLSEDKLGFKLSSLPRGMEAFMKRAFMDSKELNPLMKYRKRTSDYLDRIGLLTRMGLYVINPEDAHAIVGFMKEINDEVESFKQDFIPRFPEICRAAE